MKVIYIQVIFGDRGISCLVKLGSFCCRGHSFAPRIVIVNYYFPFYSIVNWVKFVGITECFLDIIIGVVIMICLRTSFAFIAGTVVRHSPDSHRCLNSS